MIHIVRDTGGKKKENVRTGVEHSSGWKGIVLLSCVTLVTCLGSAASPSLPGGAALGRSSAQFSVSKAPLHMNGRGGGGYTPREAKKGPGLRHRNS